jgi:hypothetical protein
VSLSFQKVSSGMAQRSGTVTSPTWLAGFTPPAMPLITRRSMRKWSSSCWVVRVALTMLTPLSTTTTRWPSSSPVVKRLPVIVQVFGCCSRASRRSASAPKAETMPMRGVQSLRQRAACAVGEQGGGQGGRCGHQAQQGGGADGQG